MTIVQNVFITDAARQVIDTRKSLFNLRKSDTFALVYESSFKNPDGTTGAGFVPGYAIYSWPLDYIGPSWVVVRLAHGTEFHLMPMFSWSADERYVMDLVSLQHEIFSIVPVAL